MKHLSLSVNLLAILTYDNALEQIATQYAKELS